jgi:hypothetical protein
MEVRTAGRAAGARVRVDGRKMGDRMGSLPSMYEGETRWRHPVWGNRDVWVTQRSRPTFYPVVRSQAGRVRSAVEKVVEEICHKIAKG